MIHYLIVIPLIVVIIYFQVRVFIQASTKIDVFKSIFPSNRLDYSIGKANIVVSEIKEDSSSQSEEDNDAIWQDDKDSSKDVIVREVSDFSTHRECYYDEYQRCFEYVSSEE